MFERRKKGSYSHRCDLIHLLGTYRDLRKRKVQDRRYFDVAYIDGYTTGLTFLLVDDDRETRSFYYVYGLKDQPETLDELGNALKEAESTHKAAYQIAQKRVDELRSDLDVIPQHTPFLL
jgi:sugar/nucleoside kinase (ribokinase family)